MEEQIKVIERLVQQAYGAAGDARDEANRMLLAFQTSKEAWQISPRLFNSSVMEVQFFGAHTLYTKIRREWEQLTDEEKESVRGIIIQLLRHLLAQGHQLVLSRLALALSAIALRSVVRGHWPNMVVDIISLNSLDTTGQLASDILAQIPDELDSIAISETKKDELCSTLRENAEKVIGHVQWVLQQSQGAKTKALGALKSWIRLSLPPALVFSNSVFGMLFSTLTNAELFSATVAVLLELLAQPLDSAVLRGALQAVLQLRTMYDQAAKNAMEPVCEGLCRLVASVGEHNADLIISMQEQEGKALVAFILECALNFWEQLEKDLMGAPPAQVAAFVPAYGALLQVLVDQCRCKPDPDDGDGALLEEFRSDAMGPLQSCYRLLGLQFFEFLVQSLQASQPPDRVLLESILFITRAAAPAINTQLKRGNFDTKVSPLIKQSMGHFLRVASENKSGDDALVETGLTMLGEYAAWFKSDPELLRAVLQCICFYLALDTAHPEWRPARAAARALRKVCGEGREAVLSQLGDLVTIWTSKAGLHQLKEKDRVFVVEGIMAVGQSVAALLSALSSPVAARLKTLIQSQAAKPELSIDVVPELHVLNSLFKCLMNTKSAPSDAALPMLRDVWPCLELLAKAGLSDEEATKALCSCFVSLLMSAKLGSAELLSPLVNLVVHGFAQTHYSCFLDVMTTIIQIFGPTKEFADSLGAILNTIGQTAFAFLQKDIAAHPDVVCAYFEMLNQALRCAPQSVAPLLTPSFSLALVSLSFPDRDTSRAVASFLNNLASNGTADALFKSSAEQLFPSLVDSLVKTINHSLTQYQGELLFHLLNRVYAADEAVRGCVGRCVAAIASPFLSDEDKQRLLGLLWKVRTKRRFTAMIADLGHVLAGEMTADVLLSYEM